MKKTILLFMIYQIVFNSLCVEANGDSVVYITRGDCLEYVMMAIGTPNRDGNKYMYTYTPEKERAAYCDFGMVSNDEIPDMIASYVEKCLDTSAPDLVDIAINYTDIVCGYYEYTSDNYNGMDGTYTGIYFGYLNYVTLEECLAFMVRCLTESYGYDLSNLKKQPL